MNADTIAAIDKTLGALKEQYGKDALERVDECVRISLGRKELPRLPEHQKPTLFYFPDLGTKPWYEPEEYEETLALTRRLEAAAPLMREEYLNKARGQGKSLAYEDQFPGRFKDIRAQDWHSFYLRRKGEASVEENCAACPRTAGVMRELEQHLSPGGAFFFSVIGPKSGVPPHHDTTNLKLTVQLALIIPPGCGIRVGGITKEWHEGKCILFDDTFKHDVWNDSSEPRVCLLVDIWHPGLTVVERKSLVALHQVIEDQLGLDYKAPWAVDLTGLED